MRLNSQEERDHVQYWRPNTASTVTGLRSRGQTVYQPGATSTLETIEVHNGVGLKIHPIISPPSAAIPELENISPTRFPSESHRAPPRPPQLSTTSLPLRPPPSNVLPQPRMEKHEKQGKKLNLRNPMSLLLKRRSGQVLEHLSDESLMSHRTPAIPGLLRSDDFDPRIRGNIVHDFSAPRPRGSISGAGVTSEAVRSGSALTRGSPTRISREKLKSDDSQRAERQHTPVFRERFEDGEDEGKNESAVRAEVLANKDFIARNSFPAPDQDDAILPPFARSMKPLPQIPEPPAVSQAKEEALSQQQQPSGAVLSTVLSAVPLSPVAEDATSPTETTSPRSTSADRPRTKKTPSSASRSTISKRASRASTAFDWQSAGLPPHMLSNSSRFSFQLAGSSAAQERLLEERHKQKAAAKALEQANRRVEEGESEDDDEFDMDAMDDYGYDGFEEDIPTVGEGWSHTGAGLNGLTLGMTGLSLQEARKMALGSNPVEQLGAMPVLPPPPLHGLGIMSSLPEQTVTLGDPQKAVPGFREEESSTETKAGGGSELLDDLYFDDGEIGDIDLADGEHFDESVFDDPSHPLYERKPVKPPEILENTKEGVSVVDKEDMQRPVVPQNSRRAPRRSRFGLLPSEVMPRYPDVNASPETLSAYHQALALAATKAAADGRFSRQSSVDISDTEMAGLAQTSLSVRQPDEDDGGVPNVSSRPSLVPDDSKHNSQATSSFSPVADQFDGAGEGFSGKTVGFFLSNAYDDGFGYSSDFDCSDYDSPLGDDPIIAAANAEALANDDEGFYGTEFGFYAKPAPYGAKDGEAVFFQGGYFGPKEWSEVKRQRSTREPNLTPITERSEYSTRNSYVSLHITDRASADRGQSSPTLATLAMMNPSLDSDGMEMLRKLKRAAFGGSQGSLVSGANASSPMNSSPVVGKSDARALWSSPISRELHGEDDIDEEIDPNMLSEANYADDDEDIVDLDRVAGDVSPNSICSSSNAEEDDDEQASSTTPERSIGSESPTIRATLHRPPSIPNSPSPTNQLGSTQNIEGPQSQNEPSPPPPPTSSVSLASSAAQSTTLVTPHSSSTFPKPALCLPFTPVSPVAASSFGPNSPVSPTTIQKPMGHSRSGSDSVAYVKEMDDEAGTFRWVVERRRMAEDGEVEIVGREVVSGGRI